MWNHFIKLAGFSQLRPLDEILSKAAEAGPTWPARLTLQGAPFKLRLGGALAQFWPSSDGWPP